MKIISKILFAGALMLVSLNACKKEKEEDPVVKPKATFMATVDGKAWQSNSATDFRVDDGDTIYGAEAFIEGDTFNFNSVRFSDTSAILGQLILTPARVGTYSGTTNIDNGIMHVSKLDFAGLFDALLNYTTTYTFTITNWDAVNKKFSATYSLTMTNNTAGKANKVVTNGEVIDMPFVVE